jgi:hypothetical protein
VSANVEYPTDSGLLAHAVTLIGKLVGRIKAAGAATRTVFRDASDTATTKVHAIGAKLRLRTAEAKEEAQATVLRLTDELADLAQQALADATAVLANARRALARTIGRQRGKLHYADQRIMPRRGREPLWGKGSRLVKVGIIRGLRGRPGVRRAAGSALAWCWWVRSARALVP